MPLIHGNFHFNNAVRTVSMLDDAHHHITQFSDSKIFFESVIKQQYQSTAKAALFTDPAGQLTIVADASIRNRRALFDLLELDYVGQSGMADGELILRAYQKWQELCLNYLVGDFSFAVWDARKEQLFLARDPLGMRTLFYHYQPGHKFCFANLLSPLFENYGVDKKLNATKVADFLTLMPNDMPNTFYQAVQRVPAGHYIKIQSDEFIIEQYWSAEKIQQQKPLNFTNSNECYQAFRELYATVIAEHLENNDPIASQLSGGLDSSSVTCMAAHLLQKNNRRITALCHVPTEGVVSQPRPNYNYDDSVFMESVKEQYDNVTLYYVRDDAKQLFEYCKELHPLLEQPPLNPTNMLWILGSVEAASKLGIRKILTGAGGNFTVSWTGIGNGRSRYPFLPKKLKQRLRRWKNNYARWRSGRHRNKPWGDFSAVSHHLVKKTALLPRYCSQSLVENHPGIEDPRAFFFDNGHMDFGMSLNCAMQFLYNVEIADPTMDVRVVEFCLRVPNQIFCNDKGSRQLIRESMAELMPEMIRYRTSRGMQAADWYQKVERQKTQIQQQLQSWQHAPMAQYIDVKLLLHEFKKWNCSAIQLSHGKKYLRYEYQYHLKLLRAFETALFIEPYIKGG